MPHQCLKNMPTPSLSEEKRYSSTCTTRQVRLFMNRLHIKTLFLWYHCSAFHIMLSICNMLSLLWPLDGIKKANIVLINDVIRILNVYFVKIDTVQASSYFFSPNIWLFWQTEEVVKVDADVIALSKWSFRNWSAVCMLVTTNKLLSKPI